MHSPSGAQQPPGNDSKQPKAHRKPQPPFTMLVLVPQSGGLNQILKGYFKNWLQPLSAPNFAIPNFALSQSSSPGPGGGGGATPRLLGRQPPPPPPPRGLRPKVSWRGSWRPEPRGRAPRVPGMLGGVGGLGGCPGLRGLVKNLGRPPPTLVIVALVGRLVAVYDLPPF